MDDRSFDRLARLLGGATDRRAGLKATLGTLLGAGGLAALDAGTDARRTDKAKDNDRDADRDRSDGPDAGKKKRKRCKPACRSGFTCAKVGKKRACVCSSGVACGEACCALGQSCVDGQCRAATCDPACTNGYICAGTACVCPSGVECGGACCAAGQTCQDGTCAGQPEPDPDTCIAFGQPCKQTGRACCGGLACGSGQGGEADVACYVPQGGPCAATGDCVYGAECRGGTCQGPLPTPVDGAGAPCDPATTVCTAPGTACVPFSGAGQPAGTYCLRPAGGSCASGEQCATGRCGYSEASAADAATASPSCCAVEGQACGSNADCCLGTTCTGRTCQAGTCDVCPSGCRYATIQEAAYDVERFPVGSTIRIAPGTYFNTVGVLFPWNSSSPPIENEEMPTDYDRNLSFRRCGTEGRVRISMTERLLETESYIPVPITRMAFAGLDFHGQKTLMSVAAPDDASRITVEMTDCRVSNFLNGTDEPVLIKKFSDLVMAGCTFRDNKNGGYGALRIEGDGNDPLTVISSLLARDCLFTGNGGDDGAAIRLSYGALGELRNCVLRENSTKYDGGAIYAERGGKAVVIDCLLENNSAAGYDGNYGGGAIGVDEGGPAYDPYPGGALSLQGSTRIVGNTTIGSSGTTGGGLMVRGADASARITVADTVTIADNITTQCVLFGQRDPQGGSPVFITDCQNWCAPDGYRVAETNDTETTPPAACETGCCSGACAYYDEYGNRYWYCDGGN